MSENQETYDNNLPAVRGLDYRDTIAPELPTLAAGLVHEIKNPLAAIHLHLQLLEAQIDEVEEGELRDQMHSRVDIIKGQIMSLNQLIQDFFRLIKPPQYDANTPIHLNEILDQVVSFIEPQALRDGIELQYIPGEVTPSSGIDPVYLKQIAINLLLNAIQAFDKSDIDMEERQITLRSGSRQTHVFFSVEDNGPGMKAEQLDRIFEPFYTTKKNGSGLGLALVNKMVTVMGGHIDIQSEPGSGTVFTVFLNTRPRLSGEEEQQH